MASSDGKPLPTPASAGAPPGQLTTVASKVLDMGAAAMQSLRPVKQVKQHVCTFALYSHDPKRQVETHHYQLVRLAGSQPANSAFLSHQFSTSHLPASGIFLSQQISTSHQPAEQYVSRLNQDFLQCAVYDSDRADARLIGVEYIVSRKIFESLPAEEQRLWHSHAHEIKSGLWTSPHVPTPLEKAELDHLATTFGKFWCTWQVDRGARLPLGAPAQMVSPQADPAATVRPDLVRKRDDRYGFSTEELRAARFDVEAPAEEHPGKADYWLRHCKGFAVDVVPHEMKRHAPFP